MLIREIVEVGGYIGRVLSTVDQWLLSYYIVQSLFLLVAPALFAASIYMTLGRIIRLVDGERHSLVRAKWLTKIFVAGDVLSFCTQGGGAGSMSSGTAEKLKIGENIVVGGLCLVSLLFSSYTQENPTPGHILTSKSKSSPSASSPS